MPLAVRQWGERGGRNRVFVGRRVLEVAELGLSIRRVHSMYSSTSAFSPDVVFCFLPVMSPARIIADGGVAGNVRRRPA
jgi:hypothetical protein